MDKLYVCTSYQGEYLYTEKSTILINKFFTFIFQENLNLKESTQDERKFKTLRLI